MTESINVPLFTSFIAGILTFTTPCVFPLIPAYLSFITGASLEDLKTGKASMSNTLINALLFVFGFGTVFTLLGASATFLGNIIFQGQDYLRILGGIVVIILGVHMTGLVPIKFLYSAKKLNVGVINIRYVGSFVMGVVFAVGWSPCIGPILSSILVLASTQDTLNKGILLLAVYSAGLAVPFLITAIFINSVLKYFDKVKKYYKVIQILSGVILIIIGLLLLTNNFQILTIYSNKLFR